jgi:hypothetical protein
MMPGADYGVRSESKHERVLGDFMSDPDASEPQPGGVFTILGVTHSGKKFRPSDWTCRLAGPYGKVEQNVVRYHPDVQPVHRDGYPGIRVKSPNPEVTRDLEAFAKANDLVIMREALECAA